MAIDLPMQQLSFRLALRIEKCRARVAYIVSPDVFNVFFPSSGVLFRFILYYYIFTLHSLMVFMRPRLVFLVGAADMMTCFVPATTA